MRATARREATSSSIPRPRPSRTPAAVSSSRAVARRRHDVDELVAALASSQSDAVTQGLEKRLATVLCDGEEMPDLRHLFTLLERLTEKAGEDLGRAEDARARRARERDQAYHQRRQATARLRAEVIQLRKTFVDLYGAQEGRDRFGWGRRTARGHFEVHAEARGIVYQLRHARRPLPATRMAGVVVDTESWIAALEPLRDELWQAIQKVNRLRRRAQGESFARQQALEECDETYLAVAQTSEALFRLAGEHFLRQRLRPTRRRVRKAAPAASPGHESPRRESGLATLLPWARKPAVGAKKALSLSQRWKTPLWRLALGVANARIA